MLEGRAVRSSARQRPGLAGKQAPGAGGAGRIGAATAVVAIAKGLDKGAPVPAAAWKPDASGGASRLPGACQVSASSGDGESPRGGETCSGGASGSSGGDACAVAPRAGTVGRGVVCDERLAEVRRAHKRRGLHRFRRGRRALPDASAAVRPVLLPGAGVRRSVESRLVASVRAVVRAPGPPGASAARGEENVRTSSRRRRGTRCRPCSGFTAACTGCLSSGAATSAYAGGAAA